jgi:hypothetical protein
MLLETLSAIGTGVTGAIQKAAQATGSGVTGAIQKAAQATGTGFGYLLATAQIESGLNPQIKAKTSSATGLFQFIEQTWLATMKQSGTELGFGRYAAAIEKTASGKHIVRDPALRAEILDLRKDPTANAAMAGALTKHNATRLKAKLGREATEGELYIAHFLGVGGAGRLINAREKNPNVKAADLFPRAAVANRSIFYDKQGGARSVNGVYGVLVTKLNRAMPSEAVTQIAQAKAPAATRAAPAAEARVARAADALAPTAATAAGQTRPITLPAARPANQEFHPFSPTRVAARAPSLPMPSLAESVAPLMFAQAESQAAPRVAPVASVAAPVAVAAPVSAKASAASTVQNAFLDLFSTDGRGAVSQAVSELWGARASAPPPPDAVAALGGKPSADPARVRPLDLFRTSRSPT